MGLVFDPAEGFPEEVMFRLKPDQRKKSTPATSVPLWDFWWPRHCGVKCSCEEESKYN